MQRRARANSAQKICKYSRKLQSLVLSGFQNSQERRRARLLCKRLSKLTRGINPLGNPRVTRALTAVAALVTSSTAMLGQVPTITTLNPAANELDVATNSNISLSFSTTMDAATITGATIRIFGSQLGLLSEDGVFSGNPNRVFNPDADFFAGELISVTVTTDAESSGGTALADPEVYQFRAEASGSGRGFFSTSTFDIGPRGRAAVIGDLDGDGDLDALVANSNNASFRVMRNQGKGTFTSFGFGSSWTFDVDGGDLDGDGDLDVVGANAVSQQTDILLNNGNGTFSTFHVGAANISRGVRIGDLDGDGDLDFIVSNGSAASEIFLNNGDASFASSTFGSDDKEKLDLGDLDGDGDLDVILAGLNEAQEIWLNNGDGTFTSSTFGGSDSGTAVAIGDLDGDGNLDAVITNGGGAAQEIWVGNGDGTFSSSTFGAGNSEDLAMGDLDSDGDLDVIIGNFQQAQEVWINNGNATFTSYAFGSGETEGVDLGDLDGDGDLDALISNRSDEPIDIWFNQPSRADLVALSPDKNTYNSAFDEDISIDFDDILNTATVFLDADPNNASLLVFGQQTGYVGTDATLSFADGNSEILLDPDVDFFCGEKISVLLKDVVENDHGVLITDPVAYNFRVGTLGGTGTFTTSTFDIGPRGRAAAIGDLDGDGDMDALIANSNNASYRVMRNQGNGTFTSFGFGSSWTFDLDIGDLDGDGDLDAVGANAVSQQTDILLNNGNGTFSTFHIGDSNISRGARIGDLDGDGDLDIIISNGDAASEIFLNNGDATFESSTFGSDDKEKLDLGDLDGDGDLDAIIAGQNVAQEIWLNNGNGTFTSNAFGGTGSARAVAIGDLDGDLDLDAIIANSGASEIWLNNGDASFTSSTFGGTNNSEDLDLGDLDGDGDLDAILGNFDNPQEIWINNGNGTFTSSTFGSGETEGVDIGDLDNDGDLDVLISNRSDEPIDIWFNIPGAPLISNVSPSTTTASLSATQVSVTGSELDVTGADISVLTSGGAPNGTINLNIASINKNGFIADIPAGVFSTAGTLTLTAYTVSGSDNTTITINNDTPVISTNQTTQATDEDSAVVLSVNLSDVDPGISGLVVTPPAADLSTIASITQQGATGATTSFLVTPVEDANGTVELTFQVSDGLASSSTTISLTVNPVNDPPLIATNNSAILTNEDTATNITVSLSDIDTDFSNLQLSVTSSDQSIVTNGGISIGATGATTSIQLDPVANTSGTSHIFVTVDDGEFMRSTTFNLTVAAVNDPPVITTTNTALTTSEDTSTTTFVSLLDIDTDFANLTLSATSNNVALVTNAGISFGATGATTSVGIDPVADANGSALITVTVDDGEFVRSTTFNLTVNPVNDPPIISTNNTAILTNEDTATNITVSLSDIDTDFSNLQLSVTSSDQSIVTNGGISIGATGATTSIQLDPVANTSGTSQIFVTVDDGEFTRSTTINLTVAAVNDPPIIATNNTAILTNEDRSTTTFVSLLDIDTDFTNLTLSATSSNVALVTNGGISFGATGARTSVGIDPVADANGSALITVTVDDGEFARSTTFNLTVNPVNDPPIIATNNTAILTNEDTATNITISLSDIDTDFSNLLLSATSSNQSIVTNGGISFGATGATTSLLLDPVANTSGTAQIFVTVDDGEFTRSTSFNLTVAAVNDPPVITTTNTALTTSEDTSTTTFVSLLDIDTDFANLELSATSSNVALVTNAGISIGATGATTSVGIDPVADANGSALITVTVDDGEFTRSTTFNLTVNPVNDPPIISTNNTAILTNEDTATNITVSLSDIDTDFSNLLLSATSSDQSIVTNGGISIGATGATTSIQLDPVANTSGTAQIFVSVDDGEFTRSTTFNLTVAAVNDPPEISTNNTALSTGEDIPGFASFELFDRDTPLSNIILTATSSNRSVLRNNRITLGATAATTTLFYHPVTNASGVADITVSADDGEFVRITTFTLTVDAVNDAPVITTANLKVTTFEEFATSTTIELFDRDTPFNNLVLRATSANQSLISTDNIVFAATAANLAVTMTPECGATGSAFITIFVSDGEFERSTQLCLNVEAIDPLTISGAQRACPGFVTKYTALPLDPTASHVWSVEGGVIAGGQGSGSIDVIWDNAPTVATVDVVRTMLSSCTRATQFVATPAEAQALQDFILVNGSSGSVNAVNNDLGTGLFIVGAEDPPNGSVVTTATSITYTPDMGFSGVDYFSYTVKSLDGCLATGAVVAVTPGTDASNVNLDFVEVKKNRVDGVRGLSAAISAVVSPDAKHVYVAGRDDHSIAIFERNTSSGTLSYVDRVRHGFQGVTGLKYVTDLVISPDGLRLYASGFAQNATVVFERDVNDGSLTFIERKRKGNLDGGLTINGMKRPRGIALSPDGQTLVTSGYSDNSIAIFRFNQVTGGLTFIQFHKNGLNGVSGLKQALNVAFSLDGKHLYVAGSGNDAIAIFAHNLSTGEMTLIGKVQDNNNSVDGLDIVSGVAVSPDGKHVYAAGFGDDAVAAFSRDVSSGSLSLVDVYNDGTANTTGLKGVNRVTISPDGAQLWAASKIEDAVVLFQRNQNTGELTFVERMQNGVNGIAGLNGVSMVALDPSGTFAYACGSNDNALAVLMRNHVPMAQDDVAGAAVKNSTLTITPLLNDSDSDGHNLRIDSKTSGSLGTVSIAGGGTSLQYAAGSTTGADSFTYTIEDGFGGSSTATVFVNVVSAKTGLSTIELVENTSALLISPNPARENIKLVFTEAIESLTELRLSDLRGNELLRHNLSEQVLSPQGITIELRDASGRWLPAGTYLVELELEDGTAHSALVQVIR